MISNNIAILPLLHCQKLSSNQSRQPATSTTSLHPRILPLHSFSKHRLIPLTPPKFHPTPARSDPRLSRCLCISLWFGSRCHPDRGAFFAPTRDLSSIPSSCPAASFSWAICRSGCPILRALCGGWEPLTLSLPLLQSVVIPKRSEGSASNAFNGFAFAWVHVVIPLALTTEATEERLILRVDERPLFDLAP